MGGWRDVIAINIEGKGNVPVGTSEVEIVISGTPIEIFIRAHEDNTGTIFLGKTGVQNDESNDFRRLFGGDEAILRYRDAKHPIYAISNVANNQKIIVGALT